MYRYALILTFFIGLATSCSQTELVEPEIPIPEKFPNVDAELRPYFQRFEDEAALRGLAVNLTEAGISGVIAPIEEDFIAGSCSFPRNRPNEVTIDEAFWVRGSELFREFIVFHELGHCYLLRPHTEEILSDGNCASIMRSGSGPCWDNYTLNTRNYYINELFDWNSVM